MGIHQQIQRGVEAIQPLVEQTTGLTLPEFYVIGREGTDFRGNMEIEWGPNNRLRLRYDPKRMARLYARNPPPYGYTWTEIAHELMHIGTIDSLIEAEGLDPSTLHAAQDADSVDPDDPIDKYGYWLEGTAHLGAYLTAIDVMKRGEADDVTKAAFGRRVGKALRQAVGTYIGEGLVMLRDQGRLPASPDGTLTLDQMGLPVDPGDEFKQYMDHVLSDPDDLNRRTERSLSYVLGLYLCAHVVSSGDMDLPTLLRTPRTDEDLERFGVQAALLTAND